MHPRLLIAQKAHAEKWRGVTAGHWALVYPTTGTVKDLGAIFQASLLAMRKTALRLGATYSLGEAIESYHDPDSEEFREIERRSRQNQMNSAYGVCLAGPELLLYIDGIGLATYFAASKTAQGALSSYFRLLKTQYFDRPEQAVIRFDCELVHSRSMNWYAPKLKSSDLRWHRNGRYEKEIRDFENSVPKGPSLGTVVSHVKTLVNAEMEKFLKKARTRSERFQMGREFLAAVYSANDDAPYGDDEPRF